MVLRRDCAGLATPATLSGKRVASTAIIAEDESRNLSSLRPCTAFFPSAHHEARNAKPPRLADIRGTVRMLSAQLHLPPHRDFPWCVIDDGNPIAVYFGHNQRAGHFPFQRLWVPSVVTPVSTTQLSHNTKPSCFTTIFLDGSFLTTVIDHVHCLSYV